MSLLISNTLLDQAGLSEAEARLEIGCRLYDAGCLTLPQARRWADVDRPAFETALMERGLPVYRPTLEDLQVDLATISRMEKST